MNYKSIFYIGALLLAVGLCQSFNVPTQNTTETTLSDWKLLGITTAKEKLDRDEIKVGLKKGGFRHLKIKVKNSTLEMKKCYVHYMNGEVEDIWLRNTFKKNTESRAIKLKGGKRFIKKVVFWYAKKRWIGPKPIVVLLGKE